MIEESKGEIEEEEKVREVRDVRDMRDMREEEKSEERSHIVVYGSGECDQLGLGEDLLESKGGTIMSLFEEHRIVSISCGAMHTLALTTNCLVYSWGNNDELALGRKGDSYTPGLVQFKSTIYQPNNFPITSIAAGDSHSIAYNKYHNLFFKFGSYRDANGLISKGEEFPQIVEGFFKNVTKILAGNHHSLLLADGRVYACGDSKTHNLGRRFTEGRGQMQPKGLRLEAISFFYKEKDVTDIFCGSFHSFLKRNNKIYGWGKNNTGQLGNGTYDDVILEPTLIPEFNENEVIDIQGGETHNLGLTVHGKVYAWGKNDENQLGFTSEETCVTRPHLLEGIGDIRSVRAKGFYSYAFCETKAYSWGMGESFVLGTRNEDSQKQPCLVPALIFKNENIQNIQLGSQHVVALTGTSFQIDPKFAKCDRKRRDRSRSKTPNPKRRKIRNTTNTQIVERKPRKLSKETRTKLEKALPRIKPSKKASKKGKDSKGSKRSDSSKEEKKIKKVSKDLKRLSILSQESEKATPRKRKISIPKIVITPPPSKNQ